ncbi:Diphthine methyltransferase-like protein [Drosera capensis]
MEIFSAHLDGNPDAAAFCPHVPYTNLLAVATYTLQQHQPTTHHDHDHGHEQTRLGSLSIFDVNAGDRGRVRVVDRVELAGVFDVKWSPKGVRVGVAAADGGLSVFGVEGTNMEDSHLSILQEWNAHEFELWAATFDIQQPYLLYTGSDDCKLKGWDLRSNPSAPVFQNSKVHTAGVCCIAKNPMDPHTLLTGSYDEHLRVWDVRSIFKPVNDTSIGLGGGVWRIKYHPSVPNLVLAACMHNGFAIVKINEGNAEVIETYNKHDSLAYGADWQIGGSGETMSNVGSYDGAEPEVSVRFLKTPSRFSNEKNLTFVFEALMGRNGNAIPGSNYIITCQIEEVCLSAFKPERWIQLNGETRTVQATNAYRFLKVYLYFTEPIWNTSEAIQDSLNINQGSLNPIAGETLGNRRFGHMIENLSRIAMVNVNLNSDAIISRQPLFLQFLWQHSFMIP